VDQWQNICTALIKALQKIAKTNWMRKTNASKGEIYKLGTKGRGEGRYIVGVAVAC